MAKRYMMSGGMAFTEERDMKKLEKQAKKGWHLYSFAPLGYWLVKGKREEIYYKVDYQQSEEELEDTKKIHAENGWTYVTSTAHIHIFRAAVEEAGPFFRETPTTSDKYKRGKQQLGTTSLLTSSLFILLAFFYALFIDTNTPLALDMSLQIALILALSFALPSTMTFFAFRAKMKQERKKAEQASARS
ncbi:DUF2812 domain-containing protein [Salsuginibacillus kocurii]|uniref:DUF2812 domain-containing protein n=1 Tax=Salsuginibacillus kocurii TaxID=427078 RepID=UPI000379BB2B|nr:DUF2812 domain-containing protein [Salsuginibacillus kocurii]